jgi:hypothetical protein
MTDDMIKEHLVRAHLAESVTLDAGTWTEVLEELLGRRHNEDLTVGNFTLIHYDGGYWLAHRDGEGMQVSPERLQALVDELWKDF